MNDTPPAADHAPQSRSSAKGLHHHSWFTKDHERARAFYEDILGIPMMAFWIEHDNSKGEPLVIGHMFYALQDGSRLSFFNVESEKNQERFKSPKTEIFNHIALHIDDETMERYRKNLNDAGLFNFSMDLGYCHSLYTMDPDGLRLEFAVNDVKIDEINAEQRATAPTNMKNWMEGRRDSKNRWAEQNRGNQKLV